MHSRTCANCASRPVAQQLRLGSRAAAPRVNNRCFEAYLQAQLLNVQVPKLAKQKEVRIQQCLVPPKIAVFCLSWRSELRAAHVYENVAMFELIAMFELSHCSDANAQMAREGGMSKLSLKSCDF